MELLDESMKKIKNILKVYGRNGVSKNRTKFFNIDRID
jgi:hypothetical protein